MMSQRFKILSCDDFSCGLSCGVKWELPRSWFMMKIVHVVGLDVFNVHAKNRVYQRSVKAWSNHICAKRNKWKSVYSLLANMIHSNGYWHPLNLIFGMESCTINTSRLTKWTVRIIKWMRDRFHSASHERILIPKIEWKDKLKKINDLWKNKRYAKYAHKRTLKWTNEPDGT